MDSLLPGADHQHAFGPCASRGHLQTTTNTNTCSVKIEGVANCFIAGYAVPDTDLLELARVVNDRDLAERLEGAYGRGVRVFGLQIAEREHVLWALDEPPTKALAELRSLLLAEHIGRVRDGLV